MTSEALAKLWATRLQALRRIEEQAADFQGCDQCRSISPKHFGLCPWCRRPG
jgi:hypothetical protein